MLRALAMNSTACLGLVILIGSGTWIRTTDPLINSQLLYR